MRTNTFPLGPIYSGRLSLGGYVGPEIIVTPCSRTRVVDTTGICWVVEVGPEMGPVGQRYVMLRVRDTRRARFQRANPLREVA